MAERIVQKELINYKGRSLVEVSRISGYKKEILKYVVCSHFDESRLINQKWEWGHYFDVWNGHNAEEQKQKALEYLIGIGDINYHRLNELATKFKDFIIENHDDETYKEFFEDECEMEDDELDWFGIKLHTKYTSFDVSVERKQIFRTKIILPEGSTYDDAIEIMEGSSYDIDWVYDYSVETDDEYIEADIDESDMDLDYVKNNYDEDDVWNWDDLEE